MLHSLCNLCSNGAISPLMIPQHHRILFSRHYYSILSPSVFSLFFTVCMKSLICVRSRGFAIPMQSSIIIHTLSGSISWSHFAQTNLMPDNKWILILSQIDSRVRTQTDGGGSVRVIMTRFSDTLLMKKAVTLFTNRPFYRTSASDPQLTFGVTPVASALVPPEGAMLLCVLSMFC